MTVDALIAKEKVSELTSLSGRQVARLVERGTFPPPCRLGRSVKWSLVEVQGWIRDQLARRAS